MGAEGQIHLFHRASQSPQRAHRGLGTTGQTKACTQVAINADRDLHCPKASDAA
jgi:hypothetical protein